MSQLAATVKRATGHVWLEEYRGEFELEEPADWHVFDPEGLWLGTVRLPPRFTVFEIGDDYVLGKRLNELDVEHVQVLLTGCTISQRSVSPFAVSGLLDLKTRSR